MGTLWSRCRRPPPRLIKFTTEAMEHNGLQLKEGWNSPIEPWNEGACTAGGIYAAEADRLIDWVEYRDDLYYAWDAEVDTSKRWMRQPGGKVKAECMYLSGRRPIIEMPEIIKNRGLLLERGLLRFVKDPTDDELINMIRTRPYDRCYLRIPNPSVRVQMAAVRECPQLIYSSNNFGQDALNLATHKLGYASIDDFAANEFAIGAFPNWVKEHRLKMIRKNPKCITKISYPTEDEKDLARHLLKCRIAPAMRDGEHWRIIRKK